MTTSLEIIDTAVKIGLGVLITAISTYVINKRAQRHELRKLRIQEATQLLRECMSKLDRAGTLINQANQQAFSQSQAVLKGPTLDTQKPLDDVLTAFNDVKDARSICYLLNHKELGELITRYAVEINKLSDRYSSKQVWDADWVDANTDKRTDLKNSILNKLADAYESIYT